MGKYMRLIVGTCILSIIIIALSACSASQKSAPAQDVDADLRQSFAKYQDLLTITEYDEVTAPEEFAYLPLEDDSLVGVYGRLTDMKTFGDAIPVRQTVYTKLRSVAAQLKRINEDYQLMVVYGYRDLAIQEKYFNEILADAQGDFGDEIELYESVHTKVAIPSVSGHPTGGAVDVGIYDARQNRMLDFGTDILDFSTTACYTFSKKISQHQRDNRELLRSLMLEEGFAPYDGEWWHFSYGDKEWALYYGHEAALYRQVTPDIAYGIK